MVPLVIADASRGTGHFSLAQGFVGSAIGIGAALSTTFAGYMSDNFGDATTFLSLAAIAAMGFCSCSPVRCAAIAAFPFSRSLSGS